ncbi:MAG: MBL fold metallo-hydrolase [Clostridia bacterium]|nr:MBL fold metallo-hydrolase [Clostridia bacterium]
MKRLICILLTLVMAFTIVGCEQELSQLNALFTEEYQQIAYDGMLHVYYLDVGQADSIFILLPNGENMLIDAGTKESGEDIVNVLGSLGVTDIDYLIGTHPHADHIGGMQQVVEDFDIGKIYMPKVSTNTKTYKNLLQAIKDKRYTITTAKAGVNILSEDNITATIVAPNSNEYDDLNNYSAVIKLTYGMTSFVFTGDAEKLSEDEIRTNIKCDVLKVGHHGSSTSTSKNFLKKTSPTYAVISCGADNDYGHPHNEVIQRLYKSGISTYRTDLNGTIEAISNGYTITFNSER